MGRPTQHTRHTQRFIREGSRLSNWSSGVSGGLGGSFANCFRSESRRTVILADPLMLGPRNFSSDAAPLAPRGTFRDDAMAYDVGRAACNALRPRFWPQSKDGWVGPAVCAKARRWAQRPRFVLQLGSGVDATAYAVVRACTGAFGRRAMRRTKDRGGGPTVQKKESVSRDRTECVKACTLALGAQNVFTSSNSR